MEHSGLSALAPDLLISALSLITHDSSQLAAFSWLSRGVRATLRAEDSWRHLCRKYWHATDERRRDFPSLSAQGLYRALEIWAPLEGYYVLSPAFPWGLLALLRITEGCVVTEVIRFVPHHPNGFLEVCVPLFRVSLHEEHFGILRSDIQAEWLAGEAEVSLDPQQLRAYTRAAASYFPMDGADLGASYLLLPRRSLRVSVPSRSVPTSSGASAHAGIASSMDALEASGSESGSEDSIILTGYLERHSPLWDPGKLFDTKEEAQEQTAAMLLHMFGSGQAPCDLALIRSPADFVPQDPSVPGIRPGLYVGDYGHGMYGQFRTEVLLLEYIALSPEELALEINEPARVFQRPGGKPAPGELRDLIGFPEEVTFMRGVKQCGDFHVPMGATTFVAVCGPPEACAALTGRRECPPVVQDRQTHRPEVVVRSWRGFGTLAAPGFGGPSWAGGWLVQFEDDRTTGFHRFGFVWDQNQDSVVLHWISTQDASPFLQRTWLPEDLQ